MRLRHPMTPDADLTRLWEKLSQGRARLREAIGEHRLVIGSERSPEEPGLPPATPESSPKVSSTSKDSLRKAQQPGINIGRSSPITPSPRDWLGFNDSSEDTGNLPDPKLSKIMFLKRVQE